MTGRLFLEPASASIRKHTTVSLSLGKQALILKDMRKFGRFTVDTTSIDKLGLDPIDDSLTTSYLFSRLQSSRQSIKVKLLDQHIIAGIGNIYAAEALFESRISPNRKAHELTRTDCARLIRAVKKVLKKSIRFGQGLDLDFAGDTPSNGLFYFGSHGTRSAGSSERFAVYGREKNPCRICATPISRTILASRATFWCHSCQPN
jgi:formamidopyrimidine-DNA glycosylase